MLVGAPQRDHSEAVVLDLVKSIRGARIAFVPFTTACTAKYGCAGKPDGGETVRQRAADAARADLDSSLARNRKTESRGAKLPPGPGGVYALTADKFLGTKTALPSRGRASPAGSPIDEALAPGRARALCKNNAGHAPDGACPFA